MIKDKQKILTFSRTLIFTQSAGGPTSTTVVTNLPNENQLALTSSGKKIHKRKEKEFL